MNFIINSIVTSSLVVVVHGTLEIAKDTKFNISLLQIGTKLYHKLGNFLLPIEASVITKLGQLWFIINWGKRYYKFGQLHFITYWDQYYYKFRQLFFIANWGKCYYKLVQLDYHKSGQLLQIRATVITNWGSYYKLGQTLIQLGQLLQIGAIITNWGITTVFDQ